MTATANAPVLIAIAGCSGSGKTTLAQELARELEGTYFSLEPYYRDLGHLAPEDRAGQNLDHPEQLEHALLVAHLRELKQGRPISRPCYDFTTHTRLKGVEERVVEPHMLLIDGIFALYYPELRALCDLHIYVEAPDELCCRRRVARDVRERGQSPQAAAEHYAAAVRPMAELYVRSSARYADLVVDGASSLDWSVEGVLGLLRKRHLLSPEAELPLGLS